MPHVTRASGRYAIAIDPSGALSFTPALPDEPALIITVSESGTILIVPERGHPNYLRRTPVHTVSPT